MDASELRRLAEQARGRNHDRLKVYQAAVGDPDVILSLLDELDRLRINDPNPPEPTEAASLGPQLEGAERRVAALEEALRELLAGGIAFDMPGKYVEMQHGHRTLDYARALLQDKDKVTP